MRVRLRVGACARRDEVRVRGCEMRTRDSLSVSVIVWNCDSRAIIAAGWLGMLAQAHSARSSGHHSPYTTTTTALIANRDVCRRTQFLVVVGLLHASPEIGKGRRRQLALLRAVCTGVRWWITNVSDEPKTGLKKHPALACLEGKARRSAAPWLALHCFSSLL